MGPHEPGLDLFKGPDDREAGFPSSSRQRLSVGAQRGQNHHPTPKTCLEQRPSPRLGLVKIDRTQTPAMAGHLCIYSCKLHFLSLVSGQTASLYPTSETVSQVSGALTYQL